MLHLHVRKPFWALKPVNSPFILGTKLPIFIYKRILSSRVRIPFFDSQYHSTVHTDYDCDCVKWLFFSCFRFDLHAKEILKTNISSYRWSYERNSKPNLKRSQRPYLKKKCTATPVFACVSTHRNRNVLFFFC